jgi:GTP-binding protein
MLVDEAKIFVKSGDGGDGMIAFRREKFVPYGGPAGGDGGHGGDVILRVNPNINTLIAFENRNRFKADRGVKGGSSNRTGAKADNLIVEVPPGTIVRDAHDGTLIADMVQHGEELVVAKGGRGGKGNSRFATASNKAPRIAEKGAPGEERWLKLELKLIADVGIVGIPNAGKSTLLSVVSNARPKIADYPFTTLEPNLGVVLMGHQDLVFADIPGLIEGAHMGVGLGHSFLRHVARTRVLVHLLNGESENPVADYSQINTELALYDEKIAKKPQVVVVNKLDLPHVAERWETIRAELQARGVDPLGISAMTRDNVQQVINKTFEAFSQLTPETNPINDEIPVYELQEAAPIFTIDRDVSGNFLVRGKRIENAAQMTYWDHEESLLRFQKILEILGVSKALEEAGVKVGDTVFIGALELEWSD